MERSHTAKLTLSELVKLMVHGTASDYLSDKT